MAEDGVAKVRQFADLRGIVWPISNDIPEQVEGRLYDPEQEDDLIGLRRNWALIKGSEYQETKRNTYFSARDVLASSVGNSSNPMSNSGIFVSTLGQQNYVEHLPASRTAPIRYTVLSKTKSERQIGRLIDKVDLLEISRLIALRDFRTVINADRELKILEEAMQRMPAEEEEGSTSTSDLLQALNSISLKIEGGLPYRAAISMQHSEKMKNLVGSMNIRKIDGFETYEEFVSRKVYGIFGRVKDANARWERLQQVRRSRISELQLSSIRQASKDNVELSRVGHAIEIFAVSYYLGTMFGYLTKWLLGEPYYEFVYPLSFILWLTFRSRIRRWLVRGEEH